jgi:hypothetical protein
MDRGEKELGNFPSRAEQVGRIATVLGPMVQLLDSAGLRYSFQQAVHLAKRKGLTDAETSDRRR